jgi:hypothetical protein
MTYIYPQTYETKEDAEKEAATMRGWGSPTVWERDTEWDTVYYITAVDLLTGREVVYLESGMFS